MALKRSMLKSMGLTEEQIESIIEAHTETVNGLQQQVTAYSEKANAYDSTRQELDTLKASGGDWEQKYSTLRGEFDTYKANIETEKAHTLKGNLLDGMLSEAGINRDSVRRLIRQSYDMNQFEVADGAVKDRESVLNGIRTEFAEFIGQQQDKGLPPSSPPSGAGSTPLTREDISRMSRDEINAKWDAIKSALK